MTMVGMIYRQASKVTDEVWVATNDFGIRKPYTSSEEEL